MVATGGTAAGASAMRVKFDAGIVDAVLAGFDHCHLPGLVVGIAVEGRPRYRKAFGRASLDQPLLLTPSTGMRIGSVSKHFTACTWLGIAEENRAGLDAPIGAILPEYGHAAAATPRQLLGHIGGIADVHDLVYHLSGTGNAVSSASLLDLYSLPLPAQADAGQRFSYNNGGYLLAGAALERLLGMPLESILAERVFAPAGLHDTRLRRSDHGFEEDSASLHHAAPDGGFDRSGLGTDLAGEGGVVSTLDDMLRWLAWLDGRSRDGNSRQAELAHPQRLRNGTSTGYGLGLMNERYRGLDLVVHGGMVMGGNAEMVKVPALGLDLMIVTNRSDISALALGRDLLDVLVEGLAPKSPAFALAELVEGVYRSPATGRTVALGVIDGRQQATIDGFPLILTADGPALVPDGTWRYARYRLTPCEPGVAPRRILVEELGEADTLERLAPPRTDAAIAGRYDAPNLAEATIVQTGGGWHCMMHGAFGSVDYRLAPLAADLWLGAAQVALPLRAVFDFQPEGQFRFSTQRTRWLGFTRHG